MIRAAQLLANVRERLAEYERMPGSPRLMHALEMALGGCWPAWASEELSARLRNVQGLLVEPVPVGQVLGVITLESQGEAALVLVQVMRVDSILPPPPALPGGLGPDAARGLCNGAALALRLADQYDVREPQQLFRFKVSQLDKSPLDVPDEIRGGSLGLSALVATWSLLSGQPVRTGLVFTGALDASEGSTRIQAVRYVSVKAREAAAAGATLVVPEVNATEFAALAPGISVKDVSQVLAVAFGEDWDSPDRRPLPAGAPKLIEQQLEQDYWEVRGGWRALAGRFERFAGRGDLSPRGRARALARAGACWTHLNEVQQAARLLEMARQVLESVRQGVSVIDAMEISNHIAVSLRDAYQFDDAIQELSRVLGLPAADRYAQQVVDARSTLGQVLVSMGRCEEGLPYVLAAQDHYDAEQDPGCSRNHGYVVDALARSGRLQDARVEHALGMRHLLERNAHASAANRERSGSFLDYFLANGELRALRGVHEPKAWSRLAEMTERLPSAERVGAWPGIGLERVRDAVRLRLSPSLAEREELRLAALREAQQPFPLLAWHRALVSIEAALSELERHGELGRANAWLAEGLERIPRLEGARRFFEPWLSRIRASTDAPEALARAIKGLLDAEQY